MSEKISIEQQNENVLFPRIILKPRRSAGHGTAFKIVGWNAAASGMFFYSLEDVISKDIQDVFEGRLHDTHIYSIDGRYHDLEKQTSTKSPTVKFLEKFLIDHLEGGELTGREEYFWWKRKDNIQIHIKIECDYDKTNNLIRLLAGIDIPSKCNFELALCAKKIQENACFIGKDYLERIITMVTHILGFTYCFICMEDGDMSRTALSASESPSQLQIICFYNKRRGLLHQWEGVNINPIATPFEISHLKKIVCVPTDLCRIFPKPVFFHYLDPVPDSFYSISLSHAQSGKYIGNICLMNGKCDNWTGNVEASAEINRLYDEQELRKKKVDEQQAKTGSSTILANVRSHELRTPLHAILGAAELLLENQLPEPLSDLIHTIHTSGSKLLSIVTNVLEMTAIESGRIVLHETIFNIREVVSKVISHCENVISGIRGPNEPKTVVTTRFSEDVPSVIVGDIARIKHILTNIIGNAMKFTSGGTIDIYCTKEKIQNQEVQEKKEYFYIKFQVSDTGVGIPNDKIYLLFKSFAQVDTGDKNAYEGAGLGLALSFELAKYLGGSLWMVKTTTGVGTCFAFNFKTYSPISEETLPREILPPTKPKEIRRKSNEKFSFFYPISIWIVEDNKINQKILLGMLKKLGYEDIQVFSNGKELYDAMKQQHQRSLPELILCDLMMPVMDGFEAFQMMRKEKKFDGVKFVAITANALLETENACLEAGMDGFIAKPVKIQDFNDIIEKLFAK